jgi:PAS domain S-box-containing protein
MMSKAISSHAAVLTESEATYKQLFDSVMEGIGIVDENEVIQVCNQAFVNIFEEDSEADMIGKSLLDMVPADQVELILSQTPQRRQNVSSQYEVNIITKRGNQKTVLASIVHRYRGYDIRRFYRGDAGFANPDLYSYLETEGYFYAIRLKANAILYGEVEHLLTRPVGRPPKKPIVQYYSFRYQAASWDTARRVVAKVEWHAGGLFPRVGFIVTNLRWRSANVVKFYNRRGTAEQWIKEGKYALNWTRLSCHDFVDNQVRLQLFALAYNLGNFLRQLALPKSVKEWSLRTLREKLIKIGAKVVRHARYVTFQMAEVLVSRSLFYDILKRIGRLKPAPVSIS